MLTSTLQVMAKMLAVFENLDWSTYELRSFNRHTLLEV
jgi:hypothetical protein